MPVPGAAPQQPVRGGDNRVEVRAGDRAEHQDQHRQPEHGGGRVLQQLQSDVVRGEWLAAMPEPTTTVTSSAVPTNSASSRRGNPTVSTYPLRSDSSAPRRSESCCSASGITR